MENLVFLQNSNAFCLNKLHENHFYPKNHCSNLNKMNFDITKIKNKKHFFRKQVVKRFLISSSIYTIQKVHAVNV